MSSTLTKRPALLVAVCILAAALTGMLLGRVTVSDAAPGADPRPVVEPITPCRILETRGAGSGGPTGVPSAGPVQQNQTLTLQVAGAAGQGGCTVANGLVGAVLNITAVNASADTFLTVFPCDAPRPNASTLNPFPQRITFNSAAVRLSAAGTVCIFNNAGTVDVVADVTGIMYNHNHNDQNIWVTVSNGTTPAITRGGTGVTAVSRTGVGVYRISFNRNINTCGWLLSKNDTAGGVASNGTFTAELIDNATLNGLIIRHRASDGTPTDFDTTDAYTLQVICP